MQRPFADKRPLGPFAQASSSSPEFDNYEIRLMLDGLTRTLKQKVEALEEAEDAYRPDPEPEDIANELRFKRNDMDSAAKKLRDMYSGTSGTSYGEYNRYRKRRDELVEQY